MNHTEQSAQQGAASWFARLRSDRVSRNDRKQFLEWLNEDPAHSAAYGECQTAWEIVGAVAGDEDIIGLRRDALTIKTPPSLLTWRSAMAVAAAVVLLVIAGIQIIAFQPQSVTSPPAIVADAAGAKTLRTAVGERSAITLEDGTVIELNTDSLALVIYSAERRDVHLVRGQALFDVASDPARPFVVEAAGKRVTALGTVFDVRVDSTKMQVTLVEGRVRVEPIEGDAQRTAARTLRPGEQLIARAGEPLIVLAADVQQQVSWRTGRLAFSDEPLGDVVAEINRYSQRKVVLADAGLAELRVSGVFRVGSMPGFVAALDAGFPVTAEHQPDGIILHWEETPSPPAG